MSLKTTIVSMGKSIALMKGTAGVLSSGNLTYCSCLVLKATRKGETLANMMCHRGLEPAEVFRRNLLREIGEKKLDGDDVEWDLVAFQTANSTLNPKSGDDLVEGGDVGQHDCTADSAVEEVSDILDLDPAVLRRSRTRGQKVDFVTNKCEAEIEPDGKARVAERSGGCVIM